MVVKGNLVVTTTERKLREMIVMELKPKIIKAFEVSIPAIKKFIREHIEAQISSSYDFRSMMGGELAAELGFEDGTKIVRAIIRELLKEIDVKIEKSRFDANGIEIVLGARFIDLSFSNVLDMPEASYLSMSETGETLVEIPWAEWLLTKGYSIVVKNYYIDYSLTPEESKRSRSGLALMKPSKTQNYRIPSGYAGTINDNVITRAFEKSEKILSAKIEEIIRGNLK